jgi:hypothetical protein
MTNGQKSAHSREKNADKIASKAKANQPKGDRQAPVTKQCKACFKVSTSDCARRRVVYSLTRPLAVPVADVRDAQRQAQGPAQTLEGRQVRVQAVGDVLPRRP